VADSPKVGVALSSGGASTIAEIGVLDELAAAGIEPACAAGTSGGSAVGAILCSGHLDAYRDAVCALTRRQVLRLFDPTWPRVGMLEGRRGMEFLRPFLGDEIESLPRPFAAIATDLETGMAVTLDRGSVATAVRASSAIPGILTPIEHEGRLLVDGGISDPIPVRATRALGAEFVIAVSVLPMAETVLRSLARRPGPGERLMAQVAELLARRGLVTEPGAASAPEEDATAEELSAAERRGLVSVIMRSGHVAQCQIGGMRLREEPPDFLITVPVQELGMFDLHRSVELVEAGRAAAQRALPALRVALARAAPVRDRVRGWIDSVRRTD
jgi:NTE family protein